MCRAASVYTKVEAYLDWIKERVAIGEYRKPNPRPRPHPRPRPRPSPRPNPNLQGCENPMNSVGKCQGGVIVECGTRSLCMRQCKKGKKILSIALDKKTNAYFNCQNHQDCVDQRVGSRKGVMDNREIAGYRVCQLMATESVI